MRLASSSSSPSRLRSLRASMASFSEAPPGNPKAGEKIFKTKCAQCHTVDKGAGHKQGERRLAPLADQIRAWVPVA